MSVVIDLSSKMIIIEEQFKIQSYRVVQCRIEFYIRCIVTGK